MGAPVPPQGNQRQYVEKPRKVYGEQYLDGQPLPIGATTTSPVHADDQVRVALPTGWVVVHLTDWVITSRYSGLPVEVLSAEEFAEQYGSPPA